MATPLIDQFNDAFQRGRQMEEVNMLISQTKDLLQHSTRCRACYTKPVAFVSWFMSQDHIPIRLCWVCFSTKFSDQAYTRHFGSLGRT